MSAGNSCRLPNSQFHINFRHSCDINQEWKKNTCKLFGKDKKVFTHRCLCMCLPSLKYQGGVDNRKQRRGQMCMSFDCLFVCVYITINFYYVFLFFFISETDFNNYLCSSTYYYSCCNITKYTHVVNHWAASQPITYLITFLLSWQQDRDSQVSRDSNLVIQKNCFFV